MIEEFKDFWSRYTPYKLHPDDKESIFNSRKAHKILENPEMFFINKDVSLLNKTFLNDLKNPEHNKIFQESINPNAIHTNMYCKTFIGDIENAKVIILYGNPGLELGDYQDEHEDKKFIHESNNDINFNSNGFLYLSDIAKETGGYNYWKNGNRFLKIIDGYAKEKSLSHKDSFNFVKKNICLLESIGYHSPKTPHLKPSDFPSSLITKNLVHNYLLPKARNNELIIFSWRQSNFWGLESEPNVVIRNANAAISSYFTEYEHQSITNFLINNQL